MSSAKKALQHGNQFPFDASDDWWESSDGTNPPPPTSKFHSAARGVIADLQDRRGIRHGFDDLDESVRTEITSQLAKIIEEAMR